MEEEDGAHTAGGIFSDFSDGRVHVRLCELACQLCGSYQRGFEERGEEGWGAEPSCSQSVRQAESRGRASVRDIYQAVRVAADPQGAGGSRSVHSAAAAPATGFVVFFLVAAKLRRDTKRLATLVTRCDGRRRSEGGT